MIYLDNNATTRPLPEVVEAVREVMKSVWANPSSVHRAGQAARQRLELARGATAALVNATDRELVLTSGGTEAVDLAIRGTLDIRPDRRVVVTSRLEHSAVRELAESLGERGVEIVWLESDRNGLIDLGQLETLLSTRADEIALVSVMWVNNETGVIQPVETIGAACREHGVRFHTDATQRVGRLPVDVRSFPVDLLSFAAHKFHGPKGVGALYVRRAVRIGRQLVGGPQERERRGGTENVPGIVGMGVAADLARAWLETEGWKPLEVLRDRFERGIRAALPDVQVNGGEAPRSWTTSNLAFPNLEAEAILLLLSERGVCASAGAACSSGSLDPSPVLLAMGVEEPAAHGSVRFSLSRLTTEDEIDQAVAIIPEAIARLRKSFAAL